MSGSSNCRALGTSPRALVNHSSLGPYIWGEKEKEQGSSCLTEEWTETQEKVTDWPQAVKAVPSHSW